MPPLTGGCVTIYGAGGPVGAGAAEWLAPHYDLRLTDARPIEEIAMGEPQSPGAPLPPLLPPPHERSVVDVTSYEEVLRAARGADALINCTVLRSDINQAFAVNTLGAWNVVRAAVECGVTRIIHTGPFHLTVGQNGDYYPDTPVPPDVPLHPGANLYAISKFLGGEITRLMAEAHSLEVFTFLYCHFMPADGGDRLDGSGCGPFVTAWEDCGEAFLYGLRAPTPPRPYEPLFICSPVPHGRYETAPARRLIGWEARHRFERLWQQVQDR